MEHVPLTDYILNQITVYVNNTQISGKPTQNYVSIATWLNLITFNTLK